MRGNATVSKVWRSPVHFFLLTYEKLAVELQVEVSVSSRLLPNHRKSIQLKRGLFDVAFGSNLMPAVVIQRDTGVDRNLQRAVPDIEGEDNLSGGWRTTQTALSRGLFGKQGCFWQHIFDMWAFSPHQKRFQQLFLDFFIICCTWLHLYRELCFAFQMAALLFQHKNSREKNKCREKRIRRFEKNKRINNI